MYPATAWYDFYPLLYRNDLLEEVITARTRMKDKFPKIKSEFELEEIEGELLLYSPISTRSIYLNSTGSIIWRLCDGKLSISEITELLQEAFPDAKNSIEKDVTDAIQLFITNNAIELTG